MITLRQSDLGGDRIDARLTSQGVSSRKNLLEDSIRLRGESVLDLLIVSTSKLQLCVEVREPLPDLLVNLCEECGLAGFDPELLRFFCQPRELILSDCPLQLPTAPIEAFLLLVPDGLARGLHALAEGIGELGLEVPEALLDLPFDVVPDVTGFVAIRCSGRGVPLRRWSVRQSLTEFVVPDGECDRSNPVMARFPQLIDRELLYGQEKERLESVG